MLIGDKKSLMFHTETLNFCSLTQRSRYYADPTGLTWVPAGQGCHSPSWPACSTYYTVDLLECLLSRAVIARADQPALPTVDLLECLLCRAVIARADQPALPTVDLLKCLLGRAVIAWADQPVPNEAADPAVGGLVQAHRLFIAHHFILFD